MLGKFDIIDNWPAEEKIFNSKNTLLGDLNVEQFLTGAIFMIKAWLYCTRKEMDILNFILSSTSNTANLIILDTSN